MSTIEEVSSKLDAALEQLAEIKKAIEDQSVTTAVTSVVGAVPAYELPALPAEQISPDEQTVQKDGSVWIWSAGFSPGPVGPKVKVQTIFGYISPKKTPELFEQAHRSLGPEGYAEFVADWQAHPYGLYSSNPGLDHTLDGNNVLFYFRVHRVRDWVQ